METARTTRSFTPLHYDQDDRQSVNNSGISSIELEYKTATDASCKSGVIN